ncbi:MAG: hypothetical protein HRT44_10020, partial [Bdellovibrionales bacterium]|nr:hypothetical protein [Bdellovibrionales bacterium]NQZ19576.1 hypothetical protein [Bdellovibrionales bacterium]
SGRSPASVASAGTTDPFGNFSGSGGPGSSVNNAGTNTGTGATEIAKNMHRGYHAANGGGPNGRRVRKNRGRRRARGHTLGDRDIATTGEVDLATAQLQRALLRRLASTGQLADKKTFLFHSMCQHYNSYEKNNNINYGRTKCPPAK